MLEDPHIFLTDCILWVLRVSEYTFVVFLHNFSWLVFVLRRRCKLSVT